VDEMVRAKVDVPQLIGKGVIFYLSREIGGKKEIVGTLVDDRGHIIVLNLGGKLISIPWTNIDGIEQK